MPGIGDSAYVSVESITLLIRAISNDMIYSQAGEIATDAANFMFPLLNDALESFENEVNNHGVDTFRKETILTPVLPNAVNDPGVQVNISDVGYFDGANNWAAPVVPSDLSVPTFLWERQTGSIENWIPMEERPDGLISVQQSLRLRMWEWRTDELVMPGATQSNDLRLRYQAMHAPLVTPNDTLYFRGATGALAYKMVSTFLMSRNPEGAQLALAEYKERINQICTRSARMKQREASTRIWYGSPRGRTSFVPPRNP